jgi:acetyl-CoA carboxylase alpha subunit
MEIAALPTIELCLAVWPRLAHSVASSSLTKRSQHKENVMRNFGCAHPEGYRKHCD